jgi:hypothetical protein
MRMGHVLRIVCILPARSEPSKRTPKRTGTGATKNLFRDLPLGREYHQAPERQNRKVDKRENLPHSRTCCYSTQPGNLTIESPKTCIPRWGMHVLGDSMLACRSGARRHSLEASAGTACRRKLAAASFSRFRGRGQNFRVVAYFQRFAVTRHILAT